MLAVNNLTGFGVSGVVAAAGPFADLTSGETVITSTTGGGSQANLIDDTLGASNYWYSSQTGAGTHGVAYVGISFASAKHIRRFSIHHITLGASAALTVPDNIKLQRKVSGVWTDVSTHAVAQNFDRQEFAAPASSAETDWRILVVDGVGVNWAVTEIEFSL